MIYNDLTESHYNYVYDKLTFYFSSLFYLNKFKREHQEFIKNETMKLRLKYRCNVYADEILLLFLYRKIEKRGFRVLYKGNELKENYLADFIIDEL